MAATQIASAPSPAGASATPVVHPSVYPDSKLYVGANPKNSSKMLIRLARPKRFELLTPRIRGLVLAHRIHP